MLLLTTSIRLLLFALAGISAADAHAAVRAALRPEHERKHAPAFPVKDSSGKRIELQQYRGKVVLLDFWATWCTGCKQEIPWFSEFQKTYGAGGLAVVGVSMDDGWDVVRKYLAEHQVPYQVLLGDDKTAQRYGIQNMPDTFLIDQEGKAPD